jgi:hypothetical protein
MTGAWGRSVDAAAGSAKMTGKYAEIESRFASGKAGRSAGVLADLQKLSKSSNVRADL